MTAALRAITQTPPPASAHGPGRRSRWLMALAALTVGLASPLLCILHCLVFAPGAPGAPGHAGHHGHQHALVFICSFGAHLGGPAAGDELAPDPGRDAAPRAVFESLAAAQAFGVPTLPLLPLATLPARRPSAPRDAPRPPPPKGAPQAWLPSPA